MKESPRSLRILFGLFGIFGLWTTYYSYTSGLVFDLFPPLFGLLSLIVLFVSAVIYLYFAVMVHKYLNPRKAKFLIGFVLTVYGISLINTLVSFGYTGQLDIVSLGISALAIVYIVYQIRKIANKQQAVPPHQQPRQVA